MYTIMGATGNIGSKLTGILLEKGQKVRAMGRSEEKLSPFVDRGAEAVVGDVADASFLTSAFSGAKGVFAMIPPNYGAEDVRAYYHQIGTSIATAIKDSGVEYVVNLSSLGAHLPDGTGPVKGLYDQEQRLNTLENVNILHLRPTFFMENQIMNIDMIKNMGINGSAIRGDLQLAMIATKDVAKAAAKHLLALDFAGKSIIELLGQRNISLNEVTKILGNKIGKNDLNYVQFSYEDFGKGIVQAGLSQGVSDVLVELNQAFNDGLFGSRETRTEENTTDTSFEEFADTFAQIYNSQ